MAHPVVAAEMLHEAAEHVARTRWLRLGHQGPHIFGQADIGKGQIMSVEDDALQVAFGIAHPHRRDHAEAFAGIGVWIHLQFR